MAETEQDVTDKSVGKYEERPYSEAITAEHRAYLKDNFPDQLPPTPAKAKKQAEKEPTRPEDSS